MENYTNFYPTPDELLLKILPIEDLYGKKILEPSAGKGNIVSFINEHGYNYKSAQIDCIEINPELRATLKGKEYTVVYDDFLSFSTYKRYDYIIMNPPFDKGAEHLLKALDLQKRGGKVICILNAETLRNPYNNIRKDLTIQLMKYNADIEYMQGEFTSAERTTDVEIAVVKVDIPAEKQVSVFLNEMIAAKTVEGKPIDEVTDLADADYLSAAVLHYQIEMEAGLKLIHEYKAMVPHIMGTLDKDNKYDSPIIEIKVAGKDAGYIDTENVFVEKVRMKYWNALFADPRFTKAMTSDLREKYRDQLNQLTSIEFNYHNIKELQIQMMSGLKTGIEETILKLFDELSFTYSWMPESGNNIHYYNGWATNKAYFVNSKVILPARAFDQIFKKMRVAGYEIINKFSDMELAFNYLAGCPGAYVGVGSVLDCAEKTGQTKGIECKYFNLTFYKKGTVHIVIKDEELLKKLNIFGGKGKNMLPPSYGKKHYNEMSPEEQAVVNDFDGSEVAYEKVISNPAAYLYSADEAVPKIA